VETPWPGTFNGVGDLALHPTGGCRAHPQSKPIGKDQPGVNLVSKNWKAGKKETIPIHATFLGKRRVISEGEIQFLSRRSERVCFCMSVSIKSLMTLPKNSPASPPIPNNHLSGRQP